MTQRLRLPLIVGLAFSVGSCIALEFADTRLQLRADEKKQTDQERIQGVWTLVSAERNGKAMPAEAVKDFRVTFVGDKMKLKNPGFMGEFKFKLNSDKKPKEIDVDMDGAPGTGIYELDGDNLKIAHGESGDKRPKEFLSKADSGVTLMVLKREKSP